MKYNIYSIRDAHTGFMSPAIDQNDVAAVRNFRHAAMQSQSLMHSHTKDYDLFCVGEYDTDTGVITSCIPRLVVAGSSLEV